MKILRIILNLMLISLSPPILYSLTMWVYMYIRIHIYFIFTYIDLYIYIFEGFKILVYKHPHLYTHIFL